MKIILTTVNHSIKKEKVGETLVIPYTVDDLFQFVPVITEKIEEIICDNAYLQEGCLVVLIKKNDVIVEKYYSLAHIISWSKVRE